MSALIGNKTLAPGETVGLLELTEATPGTLYSISAIGEGFGIVSSAESSESYDLENYKTFTSDVEILVKNLSSEPRTIRAVAMSKGDGGSEGDVKVGKGRLEPGETVGLLELAGATPGSLYTVSAKGGRLGIVAEDGSVSFNMDGQSYVTNEEIFVRNESDAKDTISVLVIPTVESSGGGGGEATIPTLAQVLDAGNTAPGVLFTGRTSNDAAQVTILEEYSSSTLDGRGLELASEYDNYRLQVKGSYIRITDYGMENGVTLRVSGGDSGVPTVRFPAQDGTLALTSDIPEASDILPTGTNGQVLKHNGTAWAAGADTNTTYTALAAAAAQAGTATTAQTISAKVLADEIDRRVAAAIAPLVARIEALEVETP